MPTCDKSYGSFCALWVFQVCDSKLQASLSNSFLCSKLLHEKKFDLKQDSTDSRHEIEMRVDGWRVQLPSSTVAPDQVDFSPSS